MAGFTDYLDQLSNESGLRFSPASPGQSSGLAFSPPMPQSQAGVRFFPTSGAGRGFAASNDTFLQAMRYAPGMGANPITGGVQYNPGLPITAGGQDVRTWLAGLGAGTSDLGAATGGQTAPGASGDPRNIGAGSGPVTGGGLGAATGDVAVLNQYDRFFEEASQQTGVPAAMLKAIAATERGWEGTSPQGAVGLMQIMPNYWDAEANRLGLGDYATNPESAILMGAHILKGNYDQQGSWEGAAKAYLGIGATDAFGTNDDSYWASVQDYWNQFGAGGSSSTGAGTPSTGGGWQSTFNQMFGSGWSTPDWGAFGVESGNGLYGYGTDYGLNGTQHTGIDVAMNPGSQLAAGFSGHVVCAGTGNGNGEDSCAAFGCDGFCPMGNNGRIEIVSDDGNTVLIYGHTTGTAVRPGQRVSAGTLLGYSGGENSGHVHLEARVRDASTPSGWRIVDPTTVLGGGGAVSGSTGAPAPMVNPGTMPYQPHISGFWFR